MIHETDRAYIAGLFDGEGSIHFKRGIEKKKKHNGKGYRISNSLRLSMEITMTDKSVLTWVHEVLGVGTLTDKPRKGKRKDGTPYLKQYRRHGFLGLSLRAEDDDNQFQDQLHWRDDALYQWFLRWRRYL